MAWAGQAHVVNYAAFVSHIMPKARLENHTPCEHRTPPVHRHISACAQGTFHAHRGGGLCTGGGPCVEAGGPVQRGGSVCFNGEAARRRENVQASVAGRNGGH